MALQAASLENHRRGATMSHAIPATHKCTMGETVYHHESLQLILD